MKRIAVSNQKGGVAKTTTACAMAAGLVRRGFRTLAVDLDPQGNLSESVGSENYERMTVYEVLKGECPAAEAIQTTPSFDILPANINLASADIEFSMTGKEYKLKEALESIEARYDYIIMDTPPSLGVMTVNAFTYADEIIIPTTAGIFAANGIYQLHNSISTVRKYCNPRLKIGGILFTRYNPQTNITRDIRTLTEKLGEFIDAPIFNVHIRSGVAVEEAQAEKTDLFSYNDKSRPAQDYAAFLTEYLKEAE